MTDDIIRVAEDLWNIRGSFKVGGIVDRSSVETTVDSCSSMRFPAAWQIASGGARCPA